MWFTTKIIFLNLEKTFAVLADFIYRYACTHYTHPRRVLWSSKVKGGASDGT